MQHMMLIGQYLSKQFVILFLANMNERNLYSGCLDDEFIQESVKDSIGKNL